MKEFGLESIIISTAVQTKFKMAVLGIEVVFESPCPASFGGKIQWDITILAEYCFTLQCGFRLWYFGCAPIQFSFIPFRLGFADHIF